MLSLANGHSYMQVWQRLPELGKSMDEGCKSDSAREAESHSLISPLSSPPPPCVSSPTIFISLTPLSPSLASVPQAPLTLWYEGTGLPTQWHTYQERQEVEFAHHQWTGNESYQTFTSSVAITQPIVEPTYNQGKGTLLCATKDSVAALTPYILFNSKNDCFQSLPIKTATQS